MPECGTEFSLLRDKKLDERMSEAAHADAFSKLSDLMAKARAGKIDFESRNPDAKVMELPGYAYIIELRPKKGAATVFGKPARLVRLYYAEPLWLTDQLVALHLATKPDGQDVNSEQNAAIREAGYRADGWSLYSKQLATGKEKANGTDDAIQ
ncbi:hypothetical protein BWQ92_04990 [Arthrobacter sp. QXT-31]|nr:hypothetical protein BWQ92_04990 [Arthrobacter sp. QXT-31]